ncbi:Peptidyl-prolyl cis-trans isomerase-like 3 [Rhynchospora pubera]|uniref:Peptidyl-prolyl cis-trans isomerase-like 3 n=1 Tax=Rhynchospora pubera TaxID=906938 RepID=A0AAV8E8Q0_9POAL|nr:Peptidyl-prolyl cis-trans isomerase-like 3 [Rhynchospora pubera]
MARRPRRSILCLSITVLFVFFSAYMAFSFSARRASPVSVVSEVFREGLNDSACCRGVDGLELWGSATKWGSEHKVESAEACCLACKAACTGPGDQCRCNAWVFCGNKEHCKDKFGECWLKKQNDVLSPEVVSSGDHSMWTSGLVFAKGEGIFGLETSQGTLRIKLLPDCAPRSVAYITELLGARSCPGCHIVRAEGRGQFWDLKGDHVSHASFGPPYALIQGTLEADGIFFKEVPKEVCPSIKRGSVAWVGQGPEFFISLANHHEWKRSYTVFGFVLPEDMEIAEKIASLPSKLDVWANVTVSVLEDPVSLRVVRVTGPGE